MEHLGELAAAIGIGGGLTTTVAWFIFKGFLIDFKKIKDTIPKLATVDSVTAIKDAQSKFINRTEFKLLEDLMNDLKLLFVAIKTNDQNQQSDINEIQNDLKKHIQNHHKELDKVISRMQSEINALKPK